MPPHHQPDLRQSLLQSLAGNVGVPLTLVQPEPEVTRAQLSSIRCKTLADMVAHMLNEQEPCLSATADGATVTVRERGGAGVMRFTVAEVGE